jgi:hypothetical protein
MEKIKHLEYKFSTLSYDLIKICDDYELRFYAWLKLWAINKSSAWPGTETICEELGWSRDKLYRALEKMSKEKGRLIIESGLDKGKQNTYDITWYDQINIGGGVRKPDRGVRKPDTTNNGGRVYGNQTQTNSKLIESNEGDFQQAGENTVENKKPVSSKTISDIRNELAKKGVPGFGR